jgi:hypothetical protein
MIFQVSGTAVAEPVVYVHSVVSAQQKNMLMFVKAHLPNPKVKIATDVVSYNTAVGLWGISTVRQIDLARTLSPLDYDTGVWDIYMYHGPGKAGPLFETVELREPAIFYNLGIRTNLNIVYDNGFSFIVAR